ncbi:MAG TPA: hypothetical protein VFV03_08250, partial [Solirubrobacteraceae bacterium]|nr:hypothetical protein [Solirubrobacteraceae bacterium]
MWRATRLRRALLTGTLPIGLIIGGLLALPLLSGAAPTPPAPKPPLAYTGYVPEVTETSATLKGGVNPRGTETSYSFQYGTSSAYGSQTPSSPAGTGTQEIKVSQALAGLTANTTYHYRLIAVSAAGTTLGQDRTFATKKIPLKIAITATHNPERFGDRFAVSGTVSGTDAANHWIVLQANPFPYLAGFRTVSVPEVTDATGNFSFPMDSLAENSQLRVATVDLPKALSPVITELVAVRVSFHARPVARHGYERLYGSVRPPEVGAFVAFQWLRRGHRPLNVGVALIRRASSSSSRFSRVLWIR